MLVDLSSPFEIKSMNVDDESLLVCTLCVDEEMSSFEIILISTFLSIKVSDNISNLLIGKCNRDFRFLDFRFLDVSFSHLFLAFGKRRKV